MGRWVEVRWGARPSPGWVGKEARGGGGHLWESGCKRTKGAVSGSRQQQAAPPEADGSTRVQQQPPAGGQPGGTMGVPTAAHE